MEASLDFNNTLAERLESRHEWLDRVQLPHLKDEFRLFQSSYSGLYQVMLKKGILHPDQYRNEAKIAEIELPPEGPFSESDKIDQMSIRLSSYELQLDFLLNFYQFSVDFFNMDRIKRILSLTKYFAWTQLSANSPNINTRTLIELITLIRSGNDQLSMALVADAINQLDKTSKNIFRYLKEISDYHREHYKMELRLLVTDNLKLDTTSVITHREDAIRQVKRRFADTMNDRPFFPELVDEILQEDYSSDGPKLKEAVLNKLTIPEDKPKTAAKAITYKHLLVEGIRILSSLNLTMEDIQRKISENSDLLESTKNTFWEKLRRVVAQMLNQEAKPIYYDIEYFNPVTAASTTEKLNFTEFKNELERIIRLMHALSNRNSNAYKRLETADEDQVLNILSKNLDEAQNLHRTLNALDVFFKSELPREERDRIRGIKPELTALKNATVNANQKRHEYIAQKEEAEQMHRLGIRSGEL